ncbi:MAG: GMC family oxidoreductase N-terminal domain-containing protein [Rhodospirillales bacterium]
MQDADFLIVGAGTAGCVLAGRLSEDPDCRVVLLEAGGPVSDPDVARPLRWPALQGRPLDWDFKTEPQVHAGGRRHAWARGRLLGGSTAINAMAHVRGHPDDFDRWGLPGWGFADLLPYFKRSENWTGAPSPWHGQGGPTHLIQTTEPHPITQAYRAAAEATGLAPIPDHNGPSMVGPTLNALTIKNGRRQTAADAYLTPEVLARPNLSLRLNAAVDRLLIAGDRCEGVACRDGSRLVATRAVLLAAGAIGTPQLLLLSGIGPADELRALGIAPLLDRGEVGANLHDHLLCAGNLYAANEPVPPSRAQHSESLLYLDGGLPGPAPDLVVACVVAPAVTAAFNPPVAGSVYTLMFGATRPQSRGRLTLVSADPEAAPLIDPNYLAEAADRKANLLALDWAKRIGHAPAMGAWRRAELLPGPYCRTPEERLAFLGKAAQTHHHPVGTCRMGLEAEAPVDPADLGVKGIGGLHVIDASILPEITTGPCNAAILAIAERASDLLRRRSTLAPEDPTAS